MRNKSLRELSKLLKIKKLDIEKSMNELKDSDNPQAKELYFKLKGELSLLEGVLEYTEFGAKSMLTVYNY